MNEFVTQIRAGQIRGVTINSREDYVEVSATRDGEEIDYKIGYDPAFEEQLVRMLKRADVPISGNY